MGRRAAEYLSLPDGSMLGVGFKNRDGYLYCQFRHPGGVFYLERGTGVEVPRGWQSGRRVPVEALEAAAKIVASVYSTGLPLDPRKVTWEKVAEELPKAADLRERTLDTYMSAVRILRQHLPGSKGPADVTPEAAKRFRHEYGAGTFKRSKRADATEYKRSPKTVENAVRRLSGLWNHLRRVGLCGRDNPWEDVPRPTVPKKPVAVPDEKTVKAFMTWVRDRYPAWPLLSLFVEVKMLAGCRTMDLCRVSSAGLCDGILTIDAASDKTHRQRTVPLPADLFKKLSAIKGRTFLWESYTEGARKYRPGTRNRDTFSIKTLYWAVSNLFREFNESRPDLPKLTPHGLRRRAITLTTLATQSVDQTAEAIGIDPATARRYYLDAKQAFDGHSLMRRMAEVLRV
jgi:integrase